jgi:hypothetical protein
VPEESALEARATQAVRDPELVELFADDPGALAIVDAIAATQRPPTMRVALHRRRLVWLAFVAAVVFATLAALSRDTSRAGVIQRALSALPNDRVVHLFLEDPRPAYLVVNLRTGARTTVHHSIEEWYDPRTGTRRVRDRVDGVAVSDVLVHGRAVAPSTHVARAIERFPIAYRAALSEADASNVKRRIVGGRAFYAIRFPHSRLIASVVVDARSYRPLSVAIRDGATKSEFQITGVTPLPASRRIARPRPGVSIVRPSAIKVAAPLPRSQRPASLPEKILGLRQVSDRALEFRDGGRGFDVTFGNEAVAGKLPQHYIRIQVANAPYRELGWSDPIPRLAGVDELVAERSGHDWAGYIHETGHFIQITTSEGLSAAVFVAKELIGS